MARYAPQQVFSWTDIYRELLRVGVALDDTDDDIRPDTGVTSDFTDAGSAINNQEKYAGKMAFNTTTTKPVWASGGDATDVWVDATGSTEHTPT